MAEDGRRLPGRVERGLAQKGTKTKTMPASRSIRHEAPATDTVFDVQAWHGCAFYPAPACVVCAVWPNWVEGF
jgi:hypothetical protein